MPRRKNAAQDIPGEDNYIPDKQDVAAANKGYNVAPDVPGKDDYVPDRQAVVDANKGFDTAGSQGGKGKSGKLHGAAAKAHEQKVQREAEDASQDDVPGEDNYIPDKQDVAEANKGFDAAQDVPGEDDYVPDRQEVVDANKGFDTAGSQGAKGKRGKLHGAAAKAHEQKVQREAEDANPDDVPGEDNYIPDKQDVAEANKGYDAAQDIPGEDDYVPERQEVIDANKGFDTAGSQGSPKGKRRKLSGAAAKAHEQKVQREAEDAHQDDVPGKGDYLPDKQDVAAANKGFDAAQDVPGEDDYVPDRQEVVDANKGFDTAGSQGSKGKRGKSHEHKEGSSGSPPKQARMTGGEGLNLRSRQPQAAH